jgi:hypothetical protein
MTGFHPLQGRDGFWVLGPGRHPRASFRSDIKLHHCHDRTVPTCDIASERRGLVQGHADPLPFAPDDVTRNVRTVCFKDKIKTIGDVAGVSNFERRPRNGNVAD